MKMNSMTGFASSEASTPAGELAWEIRSVNHRYLEAQFKLPDGFRALEPALRELVGAKLLRGKVDAALQFRPSAAAASSLQVNERLAAEVIKEASNIESKVGASAPLDVMDILRWPGVVSEDRVDTKALFEPALQALTEALDTLVEGRGREGTRTHAMLEERLTQVTELVGAVRARMPEVLNGVRTKLKERAESFEAKIDNDRLEQELVMLAQKMDVAEELDRLDAHVEEARATFAMEGAIGRKLDFLMQEFNREANTLGSKSADAETTKAAVDLKVLIEQMREQVQNIE